MDRKKCAQDDIVNGAPIRPNASRRGKLLGPPPLLLISLLQKIKVTQTKLKRVVRGVHSLMECNSTFSLIPHNPHFLIGRNCLTWSWVGGTVTIGRHGRVCREAQTTAARVGSIPCIMDDDEILLSSLDITEYCTCPMSPLSSFARTVPVNHSESPSVAGMLAPLKPVCISASRKAKSENAQVLTDRDAMRCAGVGSVC
ncbi:hypothetical protein SeMB42_g06191 [Synchytrium endobioticum]|uniref:Uncharacterized protein n=1 Tax=Synchytrium endobioticum TaxID=286115 RepID=A0A507CMH2_9FUNG|nr:hypothetical protein SeMB42_g06191 [Synchytrium endobioticum]